MPLPELRAPAWAAPAAGTRPRVLVVGPGPAASAEALRLRFDVEIVSTGQAALAQAREALPHLVLAARLLEDMTGVELLAELRTDPRLRRAPALVMGGCEETDALADELVPEDASPDHVAERVAVHLALARMRDEGLLREQVARADAEAQNRAKDEFIAMISHELRTPLGAILIWSQLLQTQELDHVALSRAIGMIERSTKTLAQLIDDLLDVSRIIAGKLSLETRPVDVAQVVDAAVDGALPSAIAKGVRLERSREPYLGHVSGDPGRLQQVLANLLSNGIKFTAPEGRVDVRLTRVNGQVQIRVADSGIGISPDFLPFIFDRFRQADTTSTRRQKGLGLGLAIARHIVEMHGGSIEAASAGEGKGCTFTVTLPLLAPGSDAAAPAEVRPTGASLAGIRILLVDDEDDAREAMVVLLGQAGADVISVASAAAAEEALEQEIPDVLLSDIAMPGEDGYALISRVRSRSAGRGGLLPAAALTAYATHEDRSRALRAGFNEHVPKPVDPSRLIAVVAGLARRGR